MMLRGFLLGVIAALSLVASLYFLKFWEKTGDKLFLAFWAAFFIEACNRTSYLFFNFANDGMPINYIVRLMAFLLILGAIIRKNSGRAPR
jgi:hypothetical protein